MLEDLLGDFVFNILESTRKPDQVSQIKCFENLHNLQRKNFSFESSQETSTSTHWNMQNFHALSPEPYVGTHYGWDKLGLKPVILMK